MTTCQRCGHATTKHDEDGCGGCAEGTCRHLPPRIAAIIAAHERAEESDR